MPDANPVLRAKVRRGGAAPSHAGRLEVAFASGVAERLAALIGTTAAAETSGARRTRFVDAVGTIAAPAVLGRVEIEGIAAPGLLALGAELADHMVDLTLGGDPAAAPPDLRRGFTTIDLALCRLHLEAILAAFASAARGGSGLSLGAVGQDVGGLRLPGGIIDVMAFGMVLRLGSAGRRGHLLLVVPLSGLEASGAGASAPGGLWRPRLRRVVASARLPVDAVLIRRALGLNALRTLRVGQVLEIPQGAIGRIGLDLPGARGRTLRLAEGRLGVFEAMKVVQLTTPPDSAIVADLRRALLEAGAAGD